MTTKNFSQNKNRFHLLTFGICAFCALLVCGILYAGPNAVPGKNVSPPAPPPVDAGEAMAKIVGILEDTPRTAINPQGNAIEIIVRGHFYGTPNSELYHSVYNKWTQKWEPFVQITFGGVDVINPGFGFDNQGNRYVVWEALEDKARIYLMQGTRDGVWSAPALVSPININAHNPTLLIDGNKVYVFYTEESDLLLNGTLSQKVKVVSIQEDIPVW